MFRKLDTIYYTYLIESPFKYSISILGGGCGFRAKLISLISFCLFSFFLGGGRGLEFGNTCSNNICTLPKVELGF